MDASAMLKYLGYSIHHQRVQKRLVEYKMAEIKRSNNSQGLISMFSKNSIQSYGPTEFKNKELGVYFSFSKKKSFLSEYKHLKFEKYPKDDKELILTEITIEPKNDILKLPLNLSYSMSGDDIKGLLGKPIEESELFGQIKWRYRIDDYKILLSLNADYQLLWVRMWLVDLHTYWAEERESKLTVYDPKIINLSEHEIIELQKHNPSARWKEYKDEWFEEFEEQEKNEEIIEDRTKALDFFDVLDSLFEEYLKMISKYAKEKNAKKIYEALKTTIRKFNEWNNPNNYIMTMERDGICEILERALRATGFEIHEDEDITLIWREW